MNTANYTRKLRALAATATWWWRAEFPVDTTTVTATFRLPAGTHGPVAMAPVTADLTVSAIDNARKILTITAPAASPSGPQGIRGAAWLETAANGVYDVEVVQITATTVSLAEPLPNSPDFTATGTLRFAWHSVGVLLADVLAAATRDVPTTVDFDERYGADITGIAGRDEMLVSVVRQPFRTGLSPADIRTLMPSVAARVAQRAQDYRPQVEWVGEALEQRVHADLAARAIFEDDIDGSRLRNAHAAWVVSCILEDIDTDLADRWMRRFEAAYDTAMTGVWVDLDRDGVVDAGEIETIGDPVGDAGGTFTAVPDANRIIGRYGQGH